MLESTITMDTNFYNEHNELNKFPSKLISIAVKISIAPKITDNFQIVDYPFAQSFV